MYSMVLMAATLGATTPENVTTLSETVENLVARACDSTAAYGLHGTCAGDVTVRVEGGCCGVDKVQVTTVRVTGDGNGKKDEADALAVRVTGDNYGKKKDKIDAGTVRCRVRLVVLLDR